MSPLLRFRALALFALVQAAPSSQQPDDDTQFTFAAGSGLFEHVQFQMGECGKRKIRSQTASYQNIGAEAQNISGRARFHASAAYQASDSTQSAGVTVKVAGHYERKWVGIGVGFGTAPGLTQRATSPRAGADVVNRHSQVPLGIFSLRGGSRDGLAVRLEVYPVGAGVTGETARALLTYNQFDIGRPSVSFGTAMIQSSVGADPTQGLVGELMVPMSGQLAIGGRGFVARDYDGGSYGRQYGLSAQVRIRKGKR